MEAPEGSQERIEAYLAGLEEAYGSFSLNQTTVSLPAERYASVRERERESGRIDAYIRVHNDSEEVLHVGDEGEVSLPGVRVSLDGRLESYVRDEVRETAGIDCTVEGLERASITGIRNADDRDCETLYHIVVVFTGSHTDGVPNENAEWHSPGETVEPLVT